MILKSTSSSTAPLLQDSTEAQSQTQLLAYLLEPVRQVERPNVFDVGEGRSDTVNFFADFSCRLHFADCFSDLPLKQPEEDIEEAEKEQQWFEQFQQQLNFPKGVLFDICLFWDMFNYLDSTAVRAFSRAMKPYLHSKTRGHSFVQREAGKTPPSYCYGIVAENTFSNRLIQRDLPRYNHTQAAVERNLKGFAVRRGVLMLDGRLELLLSSTVSEPESSLSLENT